MCFIFQDYTTKNKSSYDVHLLLYLLEYLFSFQSFTTDKPVFPEHIALSAIQKGVKAGTYLQGTFFASRENYLEGNVTVPDREERVSYDLVMI